MNKETIEKTLKAFEHEYFGDNDETIKQIREGVGELFDCDPKKLEWKMGGFLVPNASKYGFSQFYDFAEIKFMLNRLLGEYNEREN